MENSIITIWIDYNLVAGIGEFHVTYHSKSMPLFNDTESSSESSD